MKYAFIQRNKLVWPICVQCRVLLVSVSAYHQHLARRVDIAQRRHLSDEALLVHIGAVYAENRGAYGWPRIWRQLRAQGIRVGKQRVQRLMQKHGIHARGKRRFHVVTTDSRHDSPIAPNVLDRKFVVAAPNQAWVGDFTYIATEEGWLFLAVVIDLFSRKVVGWSMRPDMQRNLVIDALEMAWFSRNPGKNAGLIFHSDRGSQYASDDFSQVLKGHGITPSMSRKGNCWDNACSETLFGSLKVERLHGRRFETIREANDETIAWLLWYRLSADAVQYLVAKYALAAQPNCQSLNAKRISPHVLRHTAAMELLQAGVDRAVIALWLGHESVETTQIYLDADLAMKERAPSKTRPLDGRSLRYQPDDKLLGFLRGL